MSDLSYQVRQEVPLNSGEAVPVFDAHSVTDIDSMERPCIPETLAMPFIATGLPYTMPRATMEMVELDTCGESNK